MPPCFDVYVWVAPKDRSDLLRRFIDRHVFVADSGEPRFEAFVRSFVAKDPLPGDVETLADFGRDQAPETAFSLYLRGVDFYSAIITLTVEGEVVLGLSLDDPLNDAAVELQAVSVLAALMSEFGGVAGIGGVELPPPRSRAEWAEDDFVLLRSGALR